MYGTARLSPRTREFLVDQSRRIGPSRAAREIWDQPPDRVPLARPVHRILHRHQANRLSRLGLTETPAALTADGDGGARLLEILATGAADTDAIAAALGIDPSAVPIVIAEQLLLGTVVVTGDGRFSRR